MYEVLGKSKAFLEKGKSKFEKSILNPELLFSAKKRKSWLRNAIVDDWMTGRIPEDSVNSLLDKTVNPNTDRHLRDVLWCDIAVHYPGAFAAVAGVAAGFIYNSPELAIGSVAFHALPVKVGPGSLARTIYLAGRAVHERTMVKPRPDTLSWKKELANLGVSLLPIIGHAPVLVRMSKESPEVAGFLLHHMATRDYKIGPINRLMKRADNWTKRFYHHMSQSEPKNLGP